MSNWPKLLDQAGTDTAFRVPHHTHSPTDLLYWAAGTDTLERLTITGDAYFQTGEVGQDASVNAYYDPLFAAPILQIVGPYSDAASTYAALFLIAGTSATAHTRVLGHFIPDEDGKYDLGSGPYRWQTLNARYFAYQGVWYEWGVTDGQLGLLGVRPRPDAAALTLTAPTPTVSIT